MRNRRLASGLASHGLSRWPNSISIDATAAAGIDNGRKFDVDRTVRVRVYKVGEQPIVSATGNDI
jgi:hypothetical protein